MISRTRGFTLIELMIVVAIIGILASTALPSYIQRTAQQQVQEGVSFAEFARESVQQFYTKTHRMPRDNGEAGLPAPEQIIGNFVTRVEIDNGSVHVEFGNRVNKHISGKQLTIRPGIAPASAKIPLSWICGSAAPVPNLQYPNQNKTNLPSEYLPLECRI